MAGRADVRYRSLTRWLSGLVVAMVTVTVFAPGVAAAVVASCTVVPNPTAAAHTDCAGRNLSGTDLSGKDLSYANFTGSNLKNVNFERSNLTNANLTNADLTTAKLGETVLVGATTTGAKLTTARFAGTVMPDGSINSTGATLVVKPQSPKIRNGQSQDFTVTAKYGAGGSIDLTRNITWSTGDGHVAVITPGGTATGAVPDNPYSDANFPASTAVTATVGNVSGSATLQITAPKLTAIAITPTNPNLTVGGTAQLTATRTYEDGGTTTGGVKWSTDNAKIAKVNDTGAVTGVKLGTATIKATLSGISASTTATVVGPVNITTTALPAGAVGTAYTQSLTAAGGTKPYTWSITSPTGSTPAGLSLDPASGALSGTPTAAGSFTFTVQVQTAPPVQTSTKQFTVVVAAPLTVTTTGLPAVVVGTAYSQTLTATGASTPYVWSISGGSLPAGLSLNGSTGAISGTPNTVGAAAFAVKVHSAGPPVQDATAALSITVTPAFAVNTDPLPDAGLGQSYNRVLLVTGGTKPYRWTLTADQTNPGGKTLPDGLSFYTDTGIIDGVPSGAGTFGFTATATDAKGQTATAHLTLKVPPAGLSINAPNLPTALRAVAYPTQTLQATGGVAPYHWSIVYGALPDGLTLNTSTGQISGSVPVGSGSAYFTVQVTDFTGTIANAEQEIQVADPMAAVTNALFSAQQTGLPFAYVPVTVKGGRYPFTWQVMDGSLPAGLDLNPDTGLVSGIPITPGDYQYAIQVTDSGSPAQTVSSRTGVIVVPALTITTTALPGGKVQPPNCVGNCPDTYNTMLTGAGGSGGNRVWTLTAGSGSLPPGLTLESTTGQIHGRPTQTGTYPITVELGEMGSTITHPTSAYTISVGGNPSISSLLLPTASIGVPYGALVTADGFAAEPSWSITQGALPAGLALNANGSITGTATSSGTSTFAVQAQNGSERATRQLAITVADPLVVTTTSTLFPRVVFGDPVTIPKAVNATGGIPPYTFSVRGALPKGLTLDSLGTLSGTPESLAPAVFWLVVTDNSSPVQTASKQIVSVPDGIAPVLLPDAAAAQPYEATMTSRVGNGIWSVEGVLPPGLRLVTPPAPDPAHPTVAYTARIVGTPISPGTYSFKVYSGIDHFILAQRTYSITVRTENIPLGVLTNTAVNGTYLGPYSQLLSAVGGNPPYHWSVDSGRLPTGVELDAATGQLQGSAVAVGTFTFTVKVTDSGNPQQSTTHTYSIDIKNEVCILCLNA